VSSLWLFVVLNYLYCDVLGLYWAEDLNALLSGSIGGVRMTQEFLLGASVLMTIPMASVLASRIAPHRVARWSSVGAGVVMTVTQAASLRLRLGADAALRVLLGHRDGDHRNHRLVRRREVAYRRLSEKGERTSASRPYPVTVTPIGDTGPDTRTVPE
jgi:hypothetical protein